MKPKRPCLTVFAIVFALCVGATQSLNAREGDIITILPDGRTAILHDDKTWEISKSADNGKIVFSVVSVVPGKDEDDYENCKITMRLENKTQFKLKTIDFAVVLFKKGSRAAYGVYLRDHGGASPGGKVEGFRVFKDTNCKDFDYARIDTDPRLQYYGKRIIKKKRFKTDKEAKKFIIKLLAVSSDHDQKILKLKR